MNEIALEWDDLILSDDLERERHAMNCLCTYERNINVDDVKENLGKYIKDLYTRIDSFRRRN